MLLEEKKVGEFVVEDYRNAHLFSKHGIDFCCGGKKTLKEACTNANVDTKIVISEIQNVAANGKRDTLIESLSLTGLIEHIISVHHTYTREKGDLLIQYSTKMLRAHGERHPEVLPLYELINALIEDLMPHLLKEERVLFPAIISLENGTPLNFAKEQLAFPIFAMESEHEDVGKMIQKLKTITNNFTPPEYACTTWKICYATLAEYVEDLQTHIHLENNVLFPHVAEML